MPIPTPFHERIAPLCKSYFWKEWAGYYAVRSFDTCHEREYFAFRNAAGLIDVTALFKYDVRGKDAAAFLSRIMVKDIRKLAVGRMTYLCWCDDHGKVVDDGTVGRLGEDHYRVTAAEPCLFWLLRHARNYDVTIDDVSTKIGALALQGPRSRDILKACSDANMDALRFFGVVEADLDGSKVWISRTGYTGDLGFEIWVPAENALRVWDAVMDAGKIHRIEPAGLDAMDVTRVEAGFIMNGVDYFSSHTVLIDARKSTPYEISLGWTVQLDRDPFVGQAALQREVANGSVWQTVGLVIDWDEYEALFDEYGLPPQVPGGAWRDPRPVYDLNERQVGQATSGAFSPQLKKNLALATVKTPYAEVGTRLRIEVTVEYERRAVSATVAPTPFFDPERKRHTPAAKKKNKKAPGAGASQAAAQERA